MPSAGAPSGALSDLRVGVSRVSFPGAPSQGASPVLFLDPDQVTGVALSFSPQGVRGKHGSAQRSGASRFGSSLGTRLFYGLRSPRDGAVVTEDGVRPYPRWRSRHRRRGTSLSKMAQSSQKTGYVLIQAGAVLTEDGVLFQDGADFTLDGTEYVLIQDGAVFTLDGVRPFPRRPLMQMSPLERERVITKMAYDLTGDGCDPVGKWLLRLPVQTPGTEWARSLLPHLKWRLSLQGTADVPTQYGADPYPRWPPPS
ncbi:hypothetical protein NDU88_000370 [Pleurodeles waltl]|uniref:Uncharacterized protein n=1 Tax=Pleurodeles waltl TaxID=8319 RepID=A0AAV7U3T2_PLEWA|nr:hypothetical protein NDU88_000370 [Pleurodeles waltl]